LVLDEFFASQAPTLDSASTQRAAATITNRMENGGEPLSRRKSVTPRRRSTRTRGLTDPGLLTLRLQLLSTTQIATTKVVMDPIQSGR
jgi:hypothetical protein